MTAGDWLTAFAVAAVGLTAGTILFPSRANHALAAFLALVVTVVYASQQGDVPVFPQSWSVTGDVGIWILLYMLQLAFQPLRPQVSPAAISGAPQASTPPRQIPRVKAPKSVPRRSAKALAPASKTRGAMNLGDLRWACGVYGQRTSYDVSLAAFRAEVGTELDPSRPKHRASLFRWLNSWGCRQFALKHHATTASDSLVRWADIWLSRLPAPGRLLTDLNAAEIQRCAAAYEALRAETASYKVRAEGQSVRVTFGPTGAAKTLFAFRPLVVPPWDDPIREALGYTGDAESFRAYLASVSAQLKALAREAGVSAAALPALVGRPDSSPPKLIDEYNWVTITRKLRPT